MTVPAGVMLIILVALAGCSPAPYIVVDRETASLLNSTDWTIERQPAEPADTQH